MTPHEVIAKWSAIPFAYGADCCQFAGELIESATGYNPMAEFHYETEEQAQAIIDRYGTLEAAMTAVLGPSRHASRAQEFDAVVCDQKDGTQIAGVVYGGRVLVRTRNSITDWPLNYARRAWTCRKP